MIKLICATPANVKLSFEDGSKLDEPEYATAPERQVSAVPIDNINGTFLWSPQLQNFTRNYAGGWTPAKHRENKEVNYWYEMRHGPASPVDIEAVRMMCEKYKVLQGSDVPAAITSA